MSSLIWQAMLLGLWGVPTLIFLPFLLRSADHEMMANILVAQVYATYLALFVQFGFPWSGPAAVAKAESDVEAYGFWHQSIRLKIGAFALAGGGLALAICIWHEYYVLAYCLALLGQALNSNWFLQAKGNYWVGVLFSFIGVCIGGLLVAGQRVQIFDSGVTGFGIVAALMMPQIVVGIGTYWASKRMVPERYVENPGFKLSLDFLKSDVFFVASQLLVVVSSSLGTIAVGYYGDTSLTAAYASTEKLFNLVANGLIGLFMGVYPKLARSFYLDKDRYVRNVRLVLFGTTAVSGSILLIILLSGQYWFGLYLGQKLANLIQPALIPLAIWLMICIAQQLLTAHLVLTERRPLVLWVQSGVLLTTALLGLWAMTFNPLYWVYGMIGGQVFAIIILARLYFNSAWYAARA